VPLPASRLHVGCAGFPVDPLAYASELTFVEEQTSFDEPDGPDVAPAGGPELVRSLLAWQVITHPRGRGGYPNILTEIPDHASVGHFVRSRWTDEAWDRMNALARAVGAEAVVFRTPASFTPGTEHEMRLENFVAHADRPGLVLAWEAAGWDPAQVRSTCERLGMVAVVDPLADGVPDDEIVYLRITASTSLSEPDLSGLADGLTGKRGYVVFANASAWEDARLLAKML
jgi:uncharacterized protein YecE (DUF72 family)